MTKIKSYILIIIEDNNIKEKTFAISTKQQCIKTDEIYKLYDKIRPETYQKKNERRGSKIWMNW